MSRPQETVATRTYLEMTSRAQLKPARLDDPDLSVRRVDPPAPDVWRYLYTEVGRQYRWFDRLPWTDEEARAYLDDPSISLWVLEVRGETAGYFELRREDDGAVEIVYFGLLPVFTGRGPGRTSPHRGRRAGLVRRRDARVAPHVHVRPPERDPQLRQSRFHDLQNRAVRRALTLRAGCAGQALLLNPGS